MTAGLIFNFQCTLFMSLADSLIIKHECLKALLRCTYWMLGCIKLRGLSPRANYTDRAAAAGRRS